MRNWMRGFIAVLVAAQVAAVTSFAPVARAEGLVPTEQVIDSSRAATTRARLHEAVNRPEIAGELARLGIAQDQARASIDALSDAELEQVAGRLDQQPAGGFIAAVIGAILIVFFVLLFTDIVGLTDVYPWVNHHR